MQSSNVSAHVAAAEGRRILEKTREELGEEGPPLPPNVLTEKFFAAIWETEKRWGSSFLEAEGQSYFFDGITKNLTSISASTDFIEDLLAERYGLYCGEKFTLGVVKLFRAYARRRGLDRAACRFSHYNWEKNVLYLSRYDGTVWRLDGENIRIIANGEEALFFDDDGGVPCPEAEPGDYGMLHGRLFADLSFREDALSPPHIQRDLLTIWLYMVAFTDRFRVKPLLLVEGQRRSGKTMSIQAVQTIVTGHDKPMIVGQNDEANFGVQILRAAPIALLDNMDSDVKWLKDSICAYATSGAWVRRKLFSDTDQITIRPQAFIAISSRNPKAFRRDDVADRCIVLRFQGRTSTTDPDILLRKLVGDRGRLYGEWIYNLNRIVRTMGTLKQESSDQRLAGFAHFGRIVDEAIGLGGPLDATLETAQMEREALNTETDPLHDLIAEWLRVEPTNGGRAVTAGELFNELVEIAQTRGMLVATSVLALSHRLRALEHVPMKAFQVFIEMDHHRKVRLYSFAPNLQKPQ